MKGGRAEEIEEKESSEVCAALFGLRSLVLSPPRLQSLRVMVVSLHTSAASVIATILTNSREKHELADSKLSPTLAFFNTQHGDTDPSLRVQTRAANGTAANAGASAALDARG